MDYYTLPWMTLYGATKANQARATGGHVHYNAWGPMLFSFFVAQIFLAKTREGSKGRKKAKNVRPRTSVDMDRYGQIGHRDIDQT